jgi:NADH-quinone oxidoreductase subunit N
MVLGNLAAFPQQDMRRLMAYSGIAHTGYLLMAFTAPGDTAAWVASFYAVAYAVPSMGVMLVVAEHGSDIGQLAGLGSRRPWATWSMVVFFVSLVGIPPTVGFFGKLYLFGTALDAGIVWLVVLAVLASVVSLGYYFKVVRSMFLSEPDPDSPVVEASVPATLALAVILLATLALGASASPLMSSLGLAFP